MNMINRKTLNTFSLKSVDLSPKSEVFMGALVEKVYRHSVLAEASTEPIGFKSNRTIEDGV